MDTSEKSFVYRIMAVMGSLIFLTVIVLETVWLYTGSVLKENTDKEIRHLLKVYADSLENSLYQTDINLLTIAQEQSYLEELSNPRVEKRYYAAIHLLDLVQRLCSNNKGVDMLLASGNYDDSVSDANKSLGLIQRDEIIAFMKEKRAERRLGEKVPTGTRGWVFQRVGDTDYLMRTYDTLDYSVSAWITLENLTEAVRKMEEGSGRHIFILSEEGNVLGAILEGDETRYTEMLETGRVWRQPVSERQLSLVCVLEKTEERMQAIPFLIMIIIFVLLGLLIWLYLYVRCEIVMPVRELIKTITYIRLGEYQHRIGMSCRNREFKALNETFNSMMDTIVKLKISEYEKQLQLQEVELKYFQMQIRPHFFLNAMATIHSMSFENRGGDIRSFIEILSKNIRYMFKAGLHTVPLKSELEHLEHYFKMQELLYPGCVFYFLERNESLEEWQIPQMILHTFIENKYKHTVKPDRLLSVFVRIRQTEWGKRSVLEIRIEDDGLPFLDDIVEERGESRLREDGSGAGIINIRRTLEIMYGVSGLLEFENPEEGGSRIILRIPEHTVLQEGWHESIGSG